MRYAILGPLEVHRDGGEAVPLPAGRQRTLLIVLLLRRGETATIDSLVDALWGESPPPMAVGSLHNVVSRLRKTLGAEAIQTRDRGYAVPLAAATLDLDDFRRLAAEGREALADGRAADAARLLREALALWRGEPLADVAFEPFAQPHLARLKDERLAAIEDRLDADLALGRHAAAASELAALAAEHPLRERLTAQRMLALYRSGRQDEALRAYDDTRRALLETAGLQPGPALQLLQGQVLRQETALDRGEDVVAETPAPPGPSPPPAPGGRRRPARVAAIAVAGALLAAGAVAVAVTAGGDEHDVPSQLMRGNAVAALDAHTGRLELQVPVGRSPAALAAGPVAAWSLNGDDRTISRIDARTRQVRTFGTGGIPADVAADDDALWVANGERQAHAQTVAPTPTSVSRIDVATDRVQAEAVLPRGAGRQSNAVRQSVAADDGAAWVIGTDAAIARVDAETGQVTHRVEDVTARAVTAGGGRVVALTPEGVVVELSPRTGRVIRRISLSARDPSALAVTREAIWVSDPPEGTLWRIETEAEVLQRTVDVGRGGDAIAAGGGGVWVANPTQGTLVRIDARTLRTTRRVDLGSVPVALALRGDRLWVAVAGGPGPAAPASRTARDTRDNEACGPVQTAGVAEPDVVIASDLPLQGIERGHATSMEQAIELVLRTRRYRAGRFQVGWRSCDDSVAADGSWDETRCASNAVGYAGDAAVVGVVGPVNSGCALNQVAVLNRAGLAMVSPLNSYDGITRPAPDAGPRDVAALHPTGKRTYTRVFPLDSSMMSAALTLLRREGTRRPLVIDDGDGYGGLLGQETVSVARRRGIRLAGRLSWDPDARSHASFARSVARSGTDGIVLSGLIDNNAGPVAAAVRRELGPSVPIVANEGVTPISSFVEAAGTPVARTTRVLLGGLAVERLPARGRAFAEQFAATRPGEPVPPEVVYAAQATEVLLDAIARSDGTRASVVRHLLATDVRDGLIGAFRFDRNGDTTLQTATVLRPQQPGGSRRFRSYEGARVEAALTERLPP